MNNLYDLYHDYIVDVDPIMYQAGRVNGIYVDNDKRLTLLGEMNGKVKALNTEGQAYVSDDLRPLKRYKGEPDEETLSKLGAVGVNPISIPSESIKTCSRCGKQHVTKTEHTGRKGGQKGAPINECYKADVILTAGLETEYDVVLPFNTGSDEQLKAYAAKFKHKLGRNWKTESETLGAKELQKFIDKYGPSHPIYRVAREVRKIRKARGYAKAWVPDQLGKIYGHFKNAPETLRFSQAEHNFMNVSHRGDVPYVDELRELLVAPPGYSIVEGDSSSVEAVFSGYFMGSQSYMELARKGIHAWWACKTLGLEATSANIKLVKASKDLKVQLMYETKKRTVHGVSYGMGAKLLHYSYPELFPTEQLAQKEIDEFYALVPELHQWHFDTQKLAHKQGFLMSPWGFRSYYYRVFEFDWQKQKYKMDKKGLATGSDAKSAIAFQPQHANGMFQRENIKLINRMVKGDPKRAKWWMPAIGHVHDSNGLIVPDEDREKAADVLAEAMFRPVKQLGNIIVGVTIKAGKSWADMTEIRTVA